VRRSLGLIGFALLILAGGASGDQRDAPPLYDNYPPDVAYDGRFTFVRLRWRNDGRFRGGWGSAWNHDYPRAEQHLSQIVRELTYLDIRLDGSRILTLDDPDLFNYPIA